MRLSLCEGWVAVHPSASGQATAMFPVRRPSVSAYVMTTRLAQENFAIYTVVHTRGVCGRCARLGLGPGDGNVPGEAAVRQRVRHDLALLARVHIVQQPRLDRPARRARPDRFSSVSLKSPSECCMLT